MKRLLLIPILLLGFGANSQVTMNGTGSHSQNFDVLLATGTANPWADNSTIPNWFSQRTGTGTTYRADNGANNAGSLYSYGTGTTTERALGTVGSGGAAAGNFAHGVLLQNTGTTAVGTFTLGYTLEQWRNGGVATAQSITVWYKVSSSAITSLNPNVNTGWTQVTALTTSSPIFSASSATLDGNATANKVTLTNVAIPGLTVAPGEYVMIKWEDPDHSGSDHGLSIDDVTVAWAVSCVTTSTINVSSCESYTVPSNDETYVTSGVYHDTIPNAALCDSIITINLTIKNNTTSTISPVACGSYTVPSTDETYMVSGTYMDTIPNAAGCDSIITINLTITGSITYYEDFDTDGFGNPAVSQPGCAPIPGYVTNNTDCDDTNSAITTGSTFYEDFDGDGLGNPAVTQVACSAPTNFVSNGNDCNDSISAIGAAQTYYQDSDNDGYGNPAVSQTTCTQPMNYILDNTDCNDNNNLIHPGATEIPNNGVDEDCNGSDLNTLGTTLGMYQFTGNTCATPALGLTTAQPANATFSSYTYNNVDCVSGTDYLNTGNWNTTATVDTSEYYSFTITPAACYAMDLNQLKWMHRVSTTTGLATVHVRSSLDNFAADIYSMTFAATGVYVNEAITLSSAFDAVSGPVEFRFFITGAAQVSGAYRHEDVSLIGNITAQATQTYYADTDGDGYGNPASSVSDCSAPAGYVSDNTDCNDSNDEEFPGAIWYQDSDNDGLGNNAVSLTQCMQPANYVSDNTDCNDTDDQIGSVVMYYVDLDNDGFGDANDPGTNSCTPIAGSVTNADDCDDSDEDINPSETEVCDGLDNNCDGDTDEGFTMLTYYEDVDNDTYGDAASSVTDCAQPAGYVTNDDDCNDANAAIHPGATDNTGNGVDENCDGVDGVLGIAESILAQLHVFPNPGPSSVVLNMSNGWSGFQVTFASVDGKEVALTPVQKSANELEFNTSSLVPGVYFIRLTSASGTALVRWVKN